MGCIIVAKIISTVGLSIDILGVVILFKYAPLQPEHSGGFGIGLESGTILKDGRTVLEHREEQERRKGTYKKYSSYGLSLLILGFFLQIVGSWV